MGTWLEMHLWNSCDRYDNHLRDPNAVSGCDGGSAFMCSSNAPLVISSTLAYGTAATALGGHSEYAAVRTSNKTRSYSVVA